MKLRNNILTPITINFVSKKSINITEQTAGSQTATNLTDRTRQGRKYLATPFRHQKRGVFCKATHNWFFFEQKPLRHAVNGVSFLTIDEKSGGNVSSRQPGRADFPILGSEQFPRFPGRFRFFSLCRGAVFLRHRHSAGPARLHVSLYRHKPL